jgi:DedD protein
MERHNHSLRSAGAKGRPMKVLFECECGTSVQMPEKFAPEGCRCPCCGNEMLPAEPILGDGRIEIPVIEETAVKSERPNGRDSRGTRKTPRSQPPHLRYPTPRYSRLLKRAVGFLGVVVLIGLASVWFIGRPKGHKTQVSQPGEPQKERITLKEPSTGLTTPPPSASTGSTPPTTPSPGTGSTLSETENPQRPAAKEAYGTSASKVPLPSERSGVQEPAPSEGSPLQAPQLGRTEPQGLGQEGSSAGVPPGTPASPASSRGDAKGPASLQTAPPPLKAEGEGGAPLSAKAIPKARTASEAVQLKGKFTLTLASFKDKERAIAYRNSLKKKDLDAFEWPVAIPGQGTWYRVSVGRFPTRKAAELYARRIEASLAMKPIVNEMP